MLKINLRRCRKLFTIASHLIKFTNDSMTSIQIESKIPQFVPCHKKCFNLNFEKARIRCLNAILGVLIFLSFIEIDYS